MRLRRLFQRPVHGLSQRLLTPGGMAFLAACGGVIKVCARRMRYCIMSQSRHGPKKAGMRCTKGG